MNARELRDLTQRLSKVERALDALHQELVASSPEPDELYKSVGRGVLTLSASFTHAGGEYLVIIDRSGWRVERA